ncbi:ATP synthase F0 subunit B [Desulfonatronovibrio hydrogenovorans]|uniref:ATP synthase F0 subunit B n=1 Tax=Desulfonatronovibrio hydrogenovorans TaxID=53245 RepID=UPI0004909C25|nr:ATP synthase F0 subunit B [Desulfonatronovibrio hydrogenovorans]
MIDINVTFFIQLVNFLIILLLLNLILYKPIRGMLKKRAEIMSQKVDEIEEFTKSSQDKMQAYRLELDKARVQAQEIRSEFKEAGYHEERKIIDAASEEAGGIVKSAREGVSKDKQSAISILKKEVEKFAAKATDKILSKA